MVTVEKLTRRDNLFLWALERRLPLGQPLDGAAVLEVCAKAHYPEDRAMALIRDHPKAWVRMLEKRDARINGVPLTRQQRAHVSAALKANLKSNHPRLAAKLHRKGVLT